VRRFREAAVAAGENTADEALLEFSDRVVELDAATNHLLHELFKAIADHAVLARLAAAIRARGRSSGGTPPDTSTAFSRRRPRAATGLAAACPNGCARGNRARPAYRNSAEALRAGSRLAARIAMNRV